MILPCPRSDGEVSKNETSSLQVLLLEIIKNIEYKGIPYAIMTPSIEGLPDTSSDVDLMLSDDPRVNIEPILKEMQNQGDISILQRQHYEVPTGYAYFLGYRRDNNLEILNLDCLFDPYGISYMGRPTSSMVSGRVREWWGFRANDVDLALYFLCKRAYKAHRFKLKIEPHQLADPQQILERADGLALDRKARQLLGEKAGEVLAELRQAATVAEAEAVITQVWDLWGKGRWRRQPLLELRRVWRNYLRLTSRVLQPLGLFVVLVGPDGCGKSTLTASLENKSPRPYRRVWRFHWRPGLLPKLSRKGPEVVDTQIHEPPREAAYGTLVSLARYLYYLADFVLGYWVRIYIKKAAATLVIGERWHYDVMVNPQRYGFRLPQWLLGLGQRLVPRPNLVFLLTARPEVIHARKPELTPGEIGHQIAAFRATLGRKRGVVEVDTGVGLAETTRQVREAILDETARITQRRLGIEPEWQGFGRGQEVKVWRHKGEPISQALQLYQPASTAGRLAIWTAARLPGSLAKRGFFRAAPSFTQTAELRKHLGVMRHVLGEPRATASFATGTPGPHRKMVAQVSVGVSVRAYVKIGNSPILTELLDNESQALAATGQGEAFQAPQVIADVVENDYRYLFLSPPGEGARPRALKPDRLDQVFLNYWVGRESSRVALEEVLAKVPTVSGLGDRERRILKDALDFVRGLFQDEGVWVWPSHGDYAPWNTLTLRDGSLYVFDWEYFDDQAPALQDVFHRVFMPARLVEGLSPAQIVRRLLEVGEDPVFGPVVAGAAVDEKELSAYTVFYLLNMVGRRGALDAAFMSYLTACMDKILLTVRFKCRRPKVLVSAYACEPGKGSEPEVGWKWVQAIAKHADAWVITKGNNRGPIEKELGSETGDGLHFEYVELPKWLSFWKKGQQGVRLYYYLWQLAALARARRLTRAASFDLAHHVTFVNDWLWTFLSLLPIPFIWGPIGSHPKIPNKLSGNRREWLLDTGRWAFQTIIRLMDPLYWLSAKRAAKILCINDRVARSFPLLLSANEKILIEPAIAVEEPSEDIPPLNPGMAAKWEGLRVLFVGRFVAIKGPDLALEAFAEFAQKNPGANFTMVGEGPLLGRLRQQVIDWDLKGRVTLMPWLPRTEVIRLYGKHDVFLFPSMEGGGMVVLEAMAAGLPVVCLDFGGPGQMVKPETGIKVPVGTRTEVIDGLAQALSRIARQSAWREEACRSRIREVVRQRFSWKTKERLVEELYQSVI